MTVATTNGRHKRIWNTHGIHDAHPELHSDGDGGQKSKSNKCQDTEGTGGCLYIYSVVTSIILHCHRGYLLKQCGHLHFSA